MIDNYSVAVYDNGSEAYTLVVTRMAGGLMLNSGYVIFVVDGVVAGIVDNTAGISIAKEYAEFVVYFNRIDRFIWFSF